MMKKFAVSEKPSQIAYLAHRSLSQTGSWYAIFIDRIALAKQVDNVLDSIRLSVRVVSMLITSSSE